jgi:hypothetical protein
VAICSGVFEGLSEYKFKGKYVIDRFTGRPEGRSTAWALIPNQALDANVAWGALERAGSIHFTRVTIVAPLSNRQSTERVEEVR